MQIKFDLKTDEVKALSAFANKEGIPFYKAMRIVFRKGLDLPLNVNGGSSQRDAD